jgi:peptidyl-prolyl cis-trans isomerase D
MAIITKIQQKAGIAAGVIAVSLGLFLLGSDIFTGNKSFFGTSQNAVGEIAGQEVSNEQYQNALENARKNAEARQGRPITDQEMSFLREQVWTQFIQDIAMKGEIEKLGITVSPTEQVDLIQGKNIVPEVQQVPIFQNQQTRQFDKNLVVQYLQNLPKARKEERDAWSSFEKGIFETRKLQKYMNLLTLSAYTTTAEAKKAYEEQTAKANIRYVYVPYYSVVDSTIKVSDSDLENYLNSHKKRFKGEDTRSIVYASFAVVPSKTDTTTFYESFKQTVKDFGSSINDSAFAQSKSELPQKQYYSLAELSDQLRAVVPGAIVGAISDKIYKDGDYYTIFKFKGTKTDSLSTIRASHILVKFASQTDSAKAIARQRAEDIMTRIKAGADFATLAAQLSEDPGSARQGGDLGFFKSKQMVAPFDKAVFGFGGVGLLPSIVETEYGFHIIKVTAPKSNVLYNLLTISRKIEASQETRDGVYRKADELLQKYTKIDDLREAAKKDKSIILLNGDRFRQDANNIGLLSGGVVRQIVGWAFGSDASIGGLKDKPFDVDNGSAFVIAGLTNKTSKDNVKASDYKDELTVAVRNEKKAEQIIGKLGGLAGTLEQVAQKYGAGAVVESANGVNLAGNGAAMPTAGPDPVVLGKAFGTKQGQKTKAFKGEGGIFIVENLGITPAPAIADYTQYKNTARFAAMQRAYSSIQEAIKDASKVVDNRAKFY